MYGLNPNHPGAQAYYDSIFKMYAEWGVDYVKVDDICRTDFNANDSYAAKADIEMIRNAIDKSGREMVLSLSPGPAKTDNVWHLSKYANMWRITDDLWDDWPPVKAMFQRLEAWQTHVQPGCWPDADMLPLGTLRMWKGGIPSNLSHDEQYTLMTLWCIFRAPLMMGGELTKLDSFTENLLTNPNVLPLTQSPYQARQIARTEEYAVWTNLDKESRPVVALFNISDAPATVRVNLSEITEESVTAAVNLWTDEEIKIEGPDIAANLRQHACIIYQLKP